MMRIATLSAAFVLTVSAASAAPFEEVMAICTDPGLSHEARLGAFATLGYAAPDAAAQGWLKHASAVSRVLYGDAPFEEVLAKGGALVAATQAEAFADFEAAPAAHIRRDRLALPGGYAVQLSEMLLPVSKTKALLGSECLVAAGLGLGGAGERVAFPQGSQMAQADFGSLITLRQNDHVGTIVFPTLPKLGGTLPADWPELGLVALITRNAEIALPRSE